MNDTPIIYQIYVDSFARGASGRSPGRKRGGDLEGVLERLDHIASLGATAIWLTPIFPAPSDHGYNLTDYFGVDPRLAPDGDAATAERLFARAVDAAHAAGMKVLLDLPLNHVGHEYDLARHEAHAPRVRPPRTRQEHGWSRDLKYFDHDDEATRRFLFDVTRFWVERYGVDGYRYDYVHGIANPFWESLYRELRAERGDLFVVGEHWEDTGSPERNAREIAARFDGPTGRCFDTLFDFPFQAAAVESLSTGEPAHLVEILDLCDRIYPRRACAMLDNHDTPRIGDCVDGDERRHALALRLLASRPGPISMLYGTETGLRAGTTPSTVVDESGRIAMRWEEVDSPLVELTGRLFAARARHGVLARGKAVGRAASGGLFAELVEHESGERVLVVLNFSSRPIAAGADVSGVYEGTVACEAACGGTAVEIENGRVSALPPYGGGIYVLPARRQESR